MLISPGPQLDTKYTLTGPDGTRAVFNDPLDPDYAGVLTNITGLDSADVRESTEDLVQFDGAVHGDFFYGRRPIVIEGIIYDHGSVINRNNRIARIQRATNAMRGDATLAWTPDGGGEMFARLRRQQPLRFQGGWNKTFQASMVAADPRIYSSTLKSGAVVAGGQSGVEGIGFPMAFPLEFGAASPIGQLFANNDGSAETFPIYTLYGPGTNPTIENLTTGGRVGLLGTLGLSDVYIVDTLNRTVFLVQRDPANVVRNLVTKPTFQSASGNIWTGVGSTGAQPEAVVAPPITAPSGNTNVLRIRATAPQTYLGATAAITIPTDEVAYSISFKATLDSALQAGGAMIGVSLTWRDAGLAPIGATILSSRAMLTSGWDTFEGTFVAPPGAASVVLVPRVEASFSTTTTADDLFLDQIAFIQSDTPEYGDGSETGWTWDGTPEDSTSFRYTDALDLSTAISRYSALDFTNTDWGGLAPGPNDLRLLYASSSAGAKLRVDYRDAWL